MLSFTAILSRRRTRHLDAQWQLQTGLLIVNLSIVKYLPFVIYNSKVKFIYKINVNIFCCICLRFVQKRAFHDL